MTFFIEYFYFEGASKSQITEVRLVSIPPNQTSIKFNINTLSVATAKDSVIKIKLVEPDSNSTEFDRFDFINDSTLFAVGGGCFKSTDFGVTWTELNTNMTTTALFSVQFLSSQIGYIGGGDGNIIKTMV